jgi:hypothetical protein
VACGSETSATPQIADVFGRPGGPNDPGSVDVS